MILFEDTDKRAILAGHIMHHHPIRININNHKRTRNFALSDNIFGGNENNSLYLQHIDNVYGRYKSNKVSSCRKETYQ